MATPLRRLTIILAGLSGLAASGCATSLLSGAHAPGGWWDVCPTSKSALYDTGPEAISPELTRNLQKNFPPGTQESQLVKSLERQGFKDFSTCKTDPSLHSAGYHTENGDLFARSASVAWKVDPAGKLVWIKGTVWVTFL